MTREQAIHDVIDEARQVIAHQLEAPRDSALIISIQHLHAALYRLTVATQKEREKERR